MEKSIKCIKNEKNVVIPENKNYKLIEPLCGLVIVAPLPLVSHRLMSHLVRAMKTPI